MTINTFAEVQLVKSAQLWMPGVTFVLKGLFDLWPQVPAHPSHGVNAQQHWKRVRNLHRAASFVGKAKVSELLV